MRNLLIGASIAVLVVDGCNSAPAATPAPTVAADVCAKEVVKQPGKLILSTDSPYVFLTFNLSYVGINNRIGGIEPTSLGIGYNRERWFIK